MALSDLGLGLSDPIQRLDHQLFVLIDCCNAQQTAGNHKRAYCVSRRHCIH